ncbi:MAG TPA: tetratricopeptide repeat protein [Steroidobacteraceae bacterium]|nr:tetratricopeptide repeat protein [Steroidobacteraceae bacterium]
MSGLLRAGRFREAQAELEAIVAANPRHVEALRLLAGARQALGDAAAAETLLRRALAIDPDWTPTLATLGEFLLIGGRRDEALPFLQRAVVGPTPLARAAFLLARLYNEGRRPLETLEIAAPWVRAGRVDPDLATQHVAALVALGRREEAIDHYRNAVAAAPDDAGAAQALAIALNAAERTDEAARVAEQAIARGHRSATLYSHYARSLIARGEYARAEAALRDGLRLEPRLIEAHNALAQLLWLRTGNITEATALLNEALTRFPDDDSLWAAKAALLQGAGDSRAAYASLAERAARRQAPPMLLVRAALPALEFEPATALRLAERAFELLPENATVRSVLAAANLGVGNADAALSHCERLLASTPDDQYLIALQTTAWRMQGDARYAALCDYPNLVLPLELEPPPPWSDLAAFLAEVKTALERLHDPHGHALLFQSLRHGTETSQDLSRSADPAIQALFRSFAAPIERYLVHIGRGGDPLRRRTRRRWRFNGSWSVRLHTSGYHTNHVHPRGWISSACYIALPDGMNAAASPAGTLTFGEPSIATRPPLGAEYSVRPRIGMLVLFPSYFWHGTVPFQGDQARLTVAFDVVPDA